MGAWPHGLETRRADPGRLVEGEHRMHTSDYSPRSRTGIAWPSVQADLQTRTPLLSPNHNHEPS